MEDLFHPDFASLVNFGGSNRQRSNLGAYSPEKDFLSDECFTNFEEEPLNGLPLTPATGHFYVSAGSDMKTRNVISVASTARRGRKK